MTIGGVLNVSTGVTLGLGASSIGIQFTGTPTSFTIFKQTIIGEPLPLLNTAFVAPRAMSITSLWGYFSVSLGVKLSGTIEIQFGVYLSGTTSSTMDMFTMAGVFAATSTISSSIIVGTTYSVSAVQTGLTVAAGQRVLIGVNLNQQNLADSIVGYASAGITYV